MMHNIRKTFWLVSCNRMLKLCLILIRRNLLKLTICLLIVVSNIYFITMSCGVHTRHTRLTPVRNTRTSTCKNNISQPNLQDIMNKLRLDPHKNVREYKQYIDGVCGLEEVQKNQVHDKPLCSCIPPTLRKYM